MIKHTRTGEILHTPPQSEAEILDYLPNLEKYINQDNECDPLVNMGVIHYQFETIHWKNRKNFKCFVFSDDEKIILSSSLFKQIYHSK